MTRVSKITGNVLQTVETKGPAIWTKRGLRFGNKKSDDESTKEKSSSYAEYAGEGVSNLATYMKGLRFGGKKSDEKNFATEEASSSDEGSLYMPFDAWVDDIESSRSLKKTVAGKDYISRADWVDEKEANRSLTKNMAGKDYVSFDDWVEEQESSRSLKGSSLEDTGNESPKKKKNKKWRIKKAKKASSEAGRHISNFVGSIIPSKRNAKETEFDPPSTSSMAAPWDSEPGSSVQEDIASIPIIEATPSMITPWDCEPGSSVQEDIASIPIIEATPSMMTPWDCEPSSSTDTDSSRRLVGKTSPWFGSQV